jgi:CRP-like cAMP-binding protein
MACDPEILKNVPLFALLDAEEIAVLATQVELRHFAARERIYKKEQPGGQAYVLLSGQVRVTTVDEDQQEVIVDEPSAGEFFGFASMLEQTAHHTSAIAGSSGNSECSVGAKGVSPSPMPACRKSRRA